MVPAAVEGQVIGRERGESTLEAPRERDARIIPACSFIVRYIQRHPEWESLLAEGYRIEA